MALKIIRGVDPILVGVTTSVFYAQPGLGRTSLGYTADRPLVYDFDTGSYRSEFRSYGDTLMPERWDDIAQFEDSELEPFGTIVIDTVGRALDLLGAKLASSDPRNRSPFGGLSLAGYGALKVVFNQYLQRLRALGKDVVLLAHMDEQRRGDEVIERLDVQGGTRNEVYKVADIMGRLLAGTDGERILDFRPGVRAFGKDPADLGVVQVPNFHKNRTFLADLIKRTKSKLNEQSEATRVYQARLAELQAAWDDYGTPAEFDAQIPNVKGDTVMTALLVRTARTKGIRYDKAQGSFVLADAAGSSAEAKPAKEAPGNGKTKTPAPSPAPAPKPKPKPAPKPKPKPDPKPATNPAEPDDLTF